MTLSALLLFSAAIFGVGVYGALSQQSFVMIMMGLELMINASILAAGAFWAYSTDGPPKGQMLIVVFMTVMAVEASLGFALVIGIYRLRKADITEKLKKLKA
jgi:NAD(P)H-quinone oxidoreductase subunit 4L